MAHGKLDGLAIRGLNRADWLRYCVLSSWEDLDNLTLNFWVSHDLVILEKGVLIHITEDVTTGEHGALLKCLIGTESPELVLIEAWQFDTSWDENTLSLIGDVFQWSLNSVENSLQNTCAIKILIINKLDWHEVRVKI